MSTTPSTLLQMQIPAEQRGKVQKPQIAQRQKTQGIVKSDSSVQQPQDSNKTRVVETKIPDSQLQQVQFRIMEPREFGQLISQKTATV